MTLPTFLGLLTLVLFALVLGLTSGCSAGNVRPLTYTSVDDPIWDINPEKWTPVGNKLTDPPTPPAGRIPSAGN